MIQKSSRTLLLAVPLLVAMACAPPAFSQGQEAGAAAPSVECSSPSECAQLGSKYLLGRGVKRDDALAEQLLRRACDGGDPEGCALLGVLHDKGRGVEQSHARAAELYRKACDGGSNLGCSNLAVLFLKGRGVEQSDSKARELFQKACDGGDSEACKALRVIPLHAQGAVELTDPADDMGPITTSEGEELPLDVVALAIKSDGRRLTFAATLKDPPGRFAAPPVSLRIDTDNDSSTGFTPTRLEAGGFEFQATLHLCIEYSNGAAACVGGSAGAEPVARYAAMELERFEPGGGTTARPWSTPWASRANGP
jgi:hypothetical protein